MRGQSNKALLACLLGALALTLPFALRAQTKAASPDSSIVKCVGTIKSAALDSITVNAESSGEVTARIATSTKLLRVPPGEKDLKNAVALQVQDLQAGDRVLVRGQATADAHTIAALAVIVMKQGDVSAKQQREREDWRKRGVDGLVSKVDSAAGRITISAGTLGDSHDVVVRLGKDTMLRRYAPNSVRFEDAKPAPLDQIKPGDQLRARGSRNADSTEISAEEVVSGSFRNIAGTITAVDAATNSVTVQDRIAKSEVVVRISPDSQVKKLPAEMAQRIAARLKSGTGQNGDHEAGSAARGNMPGASGQSGAPVPPAAAGGHQPPQSPGAAGQGGASNGNGPPDFQRLLGRLPNNAVTDLQKGDVVMVLSTQGGEAGTPTAITFLAGVEPILTAAPSRTASSLLSPWSLNTSGGETEAVP